MESAVADTVRNATAPLMEQLGDLRAEMDALFSNAFELSETLSAGPLDVEPTPQQVKSWSAVVIFWIATAAAGFWIGSDPHLGVIFPALAILVTLYDRCF